MRFPDWDPLVHQPRLFGEQYRKSESKPLLDLSDWGMPAVVAPSTSSLSPKYAILVATPSSARASVRVSGINRCSNEERTLLPINGFL